MSPPCCLSPFCWARPHILALCILLISKPVVSLELDRFAVGYDHLDTSLLCKLALEENLDELFYGLGWNYLGLQVVEFKEEGGLRVFEGVEVSKL